MNIQIDLQNHQSFDQSRSNGIGLAYGIASYLILSNNLFRNIKRRLMNHTSVMLKERMTRLQYSLQIYDF